MGDMQNQPPSKIITPAEYLKGRIQVAMEHLLENKDMVPAESAVLQTILRFILEMLPEVIDLFEGSAKPAGAGGEVAGQAEANESKGT